MINLRSGRLVKYEPRVTKAFNVRGRAPTARTENIVVTSDFEITRLAREHGVGVVSPDDSKPTALGNAYYYETQLDRLSKLSGSPQKYLLLEFDHNYLYYGVGPLPLRGPRPIVAASTQREKWPKPSSMDSLTIEVTYDGPATEGLTHPARSSAMGGSALNYAAAMIDSEWAHSRSWEWLHIVGHAISGNNEVGNLVAGTFDANTEMIPFECKVQELAKTCPSVNVEWKVTFFPDSWVAIDLTMRISAITPKGLFCDTKTFQCTRDIVYDRFLYDLHKS